ncbi:MAG: ribbon-helix-helix protein, CopG family [Sporichthyaceae bacterium]
MGNVTQVAFQIDDASLSAVDALAAQAAQSRAEVLRTAVRELLARHREAAVDAALERGYGAVPPDPEQLAHADLSVAGLAVAELDW